MQPQRERIDLAEAEEPTGGQQAFPRQREAPGGLSPATSQL